MRPYDMRISQMRTAIQNKTISKRGAEAYAILAVAERLERLCELADDYIALRRGGWRYLARHGELNDNGRAAGEGGP